MSLLGPAPGDDDADDDGHGSPRPSRQGRANNSTSTSVGRGDQSTQQLLRSAPPTAIVYPPVSRGGDDSTDGIYVGKRGLFRALVASPTFWLLCLCDFLITTIKESVSSFAAAYLEVCCCCCCCCCLFLSCCCLLALMLRSITVDLHSTGC